MYLNSGQPPLLHSRHGRLRATLCVQSKRAPKGPSASTLALQPGIILRGPNRINFRQVGRT